MGLEKTIKVRIVLIAKLLVGIFGVVPTRASEATSPDPISQGICPYRKQNNSSLLTSFKG